MAFFAKGSNFALLVPQQRSVNEVGHPSQKITMDCQATSNTKDPNENSPGNYSPEGKRVLVTHASLSRFDRHNTLIVAGPDFTPAPHEVDDVVAKVCQIRAPTKGLGTNGHRR